MQTCEICRTIRPDSQDVCDCAQADLAVPSGTRDRLPRFTTISLFTTFGVEAAILFVKKSGANGFDLTPVLVLFLAIVGVVVNLISGWYAHKRGEAWGGRIAALGIALWVASLWA